MAGRAGLACRRGRPGSSPARKRLKPLRTVVAWRGRAEWDQVMVGLYCGDSRLQQEALDRVSAWKSRYGPKMPLAVDCTAELIRCKVLDSSGRLKSHELILSYGLALVRFVNLITERKQKMVSIPLRQLAKEVDIPIWVVDLRHELTHGKLPRLALCRKGCDVVLDWLRKTYWSRQLGNNLCEESEDEDEEQQGVEASAELDNDAWEIQTPQHEACQKHKEFHEKVRDVLISYKNEQFRVMQTVQSVSKSRELWSDSSSEVDWILAQIKDLMQENREAVAEALLSDGFLIPKMDCLKMLNIKYEANKELWQFKIPQTFYCFWQPLLTGLLSRSFTQILIEKMFVELKECSDSSELRPQFLINWISEMLTGIAKVNAGKKRQQHCNKQVSVKELFLHKVPLQWIRLTDSCLEAPCWATPHLLQLILTIMRPRLPRSSRKNLLYLASVYTEGGGPLSSPGVSSDCSEQPIYTIESLQWRARQENQVKNQAQTVEKQDDVLERDDGVEEVEEEEEEEMVTETNPLEGLARSGNLAAIAEKRAALQGSAWQITADEVQWKDFPLGKLPGQTDDPDGLMLDNYSMMSLLDQPVRDEWKPPSTNSAELNIPATGGLLWTQNDFHKIKSGLQLF
ncbi:ribosomal biogenesis protein LAS1L [Falco rusticolus]|uniref:ribosomal biogenesis protein LAS1L n=1 Tax=Falco rusticolus TaxID=120794 RepID=UPI0018868705|nr:ribosomal biogenesis protein LAS1L [Falco rusticolus]